MRVGFAGIDFTPAPGLPLMGNFRDDYASRGVHDPLFAKAMVFEDAHGNRAAVLALDVCMVNRDNVSLMRDVIGSECRIPPENVLIHATHTHAAPAPCDKFLFGCDFEPFRAATEAFLARAAGAVASAEANLAEASLAVGYATEDRLAFNRRLRRKDGATQMNWDALAPGFQPDEIEDAWGPADPRVACLVVERMGRPVASLVNFGLHPAILAGDNWLYSADYPGYLTESLRRTLDPGFETLFVDGCCGNVNHVDYRDPLQGRGYSMAQRVGYMLGAAAHQAIAARTPVTADRVAVSTQQVVLTRTQITSAEEARCRKILDDARGDAPAGQVDGLPEAFFAKLRLEMAARQYEPDQVEVMALRVGDVALVGLPGEAFCELGMTIRSRSRASHTIVAGLSNDAIGYLPTQESFDQGGYETTVGSTFYQSGAGEQLAESALAQVDRLFAACEPQGSRLS